MKYAQYILIVLLSVLLVFMVKRNQSLESKNESKDSIINELQGHVREAINENGTLRFEKKSALASAEEIQKYYKDYVERINENHDVQIKNLHAYIEAQISASGEGQAQIIYLPQPGQDSALYPSVDVKDGYLSLSGTWSDNLFRYKYQYQDSISFATSWETKGWWVFKRKENLKISFHSTNPNAKMNTATSIVMKKPPAPKFSLGPGVSVLIVDGRLMAAPGISVHYSMVRF